jgi:two-component system, OmpR family, phosphate regulon response regulator PhoB
LRVLIADNDPNEVERLRKTLADLGHEVLTTDTGSDALRIAEGQQPDVAIFDTILRDFSGLALLRQLRLNPDTRQMVVILIHPDPKDDDVFFGFRYCSDMQLPRPAPTDELVFFLSRVASVTDEGGPRRDRFAHHWSPIWDAERDTTVFDGARNATS